MLKNSRLMVSRKKAVVWGISGLCCLALMGCEKGNAARPATGGIENVGVLSLRPSELTLDTELSGRTVAYMSADIRPQVGGIINKRAFTEGGYVKTGELLYQIDPSSYQSAVNSLQASVAKAKAVLAAAELKAKRQTELLAIAAISKQDYEDVIATRDEAAATLAGAQADLNTAQINLAHTRITAPISGVVATSTVTPGALVSASQTTALTTVQQLDPIYVDIPQSSTQLLQLRNAAANGKVKALADSGLPIKLTLEDGSNYQYPGRLQVTGTTVDTSTGMVTLRAQVPNPQHLLLPGMFVRARLDQARISQAILVPQAAVSRASNGQATAMVVGQDNKVSLRNITVANAIGNTWYVTAGLAGGDRVIVEGGAKVKPGQTVHAEEISASATQAASAPAKN